MINLRKILIAGVAIAALAATVAGSTTEASAHPGWGWGHGGWGWGLGALAVGAAAAAASSSAYDEDDCYYASQKVYNSYGDFVGYRRVEVCN